MYFLSGDVGIIQKICSLKLHSSGRLCDGGSGMCISGCCLSILIIPSLSVHFAASVIPGLRISLPPALMGVVQLFSLSYPTADTLVALEHDVCVWGVL